MGVLAVKTIRTITSYSCSGVRHSRGYPDINETLVVKSLRVEKVKSDEIPALWEETSKSSPSSKSEKPYKRV